MNSYPRLAVDRDGRPWLAFRHRQEAIWGNNAVMVVGGVWVEYATALEGRTLVDAPAPAPERQPARQPPGAGADRGRPGPGLLQHRRPAPPRGRVHARAGPPLLHPLRDARGGGRQRHRSRRAHLARSRPPTRSSIEPAAGDEARPRVHPDEAADIARMRDYRVKAGGKTYQLLRGEFHRHTEISTDGGSDGVARRHVALRPRRRAPRLDRQRRPRQRRRPGIHLVAGPEDHRPLPPGPSFVPMFTYERSVSYPDGHRNVMFPRRGVRTLPRLVDADRAWPTPTPRCSTTT